MNRKTRDIFVLMVFMIVIPVAKCSDEDFACCPPSNFIYQKECLDSKNNNTSAVRIVCEWGADTWKNNNFTIDSSGKMVVKLIDALPPFTFTSDLICHGKEITNKIDLENSANVLLLCKENYNENAELNDAFVYCLVISVVFFVLTAIIYALFNELRDLFGWSVINFCASSALGYAFFSYLRLVTPSHMGFCAAQGYLSYYFLLAAFFWTNSISIQVLKDTRRPSVSVCGWRELKYYAVYSWGVPALLTVIMAIVNHHPGDHTKPGIGLQHCWFTDLTQQWYYMFSVMAILLVINFAIFLYVASIIWRLTFSSTPIKALKFKLWLTIKLILLMGLPWIFQMINVDPGTNEVILAIVVNILIGLQGLLIFLVLVIRKRVVKAAYSRGLLEWCGGPVERWLARGDDAETSVVAHTDVPMGNGDNR